MRRRLTLFVLSVVTASTVVAAEPPDRWRAVAKAPRSALPDVELTLGYPGPYVPTWNAPIELRATARRPFKGYIGFHFAVGSQATRELPVVSPARLGPGETWTFSTWARLKPAELRRLSGSLLNREVVVIWRNEQMAVVGRTSVGVPPWSVPRPLYIGTAAPPRVLGAEPYAVAPEALSDVAQWYLGFSSVVVGLSQWHDLRPEFRDVIVSSAQPLVFTGFAARGRAMSVVDRALLPVEFQEGEAAYSVPWPYPLPRIRTAQWSWKRKPETAAVDDGANPPLVMGRAASWAATEDLIADPLPETDVIPAGVVYLSSVRKWSLRIVAAEFFPLAAGVAVILISVGAWVALRKHPRVATAGFVVAFALVPIAIRGQLRPGPSVHTEERVLALGEGLVLRSVKATEVGAAPLRATPVEASLARSAAFSEQTTGETEIRMAGTPIGFGAMFHPNLGWDSTVRVWTRRELGTSASVRIVESKPGRLVFDYESPERVDYAVAFWVAEGKSWRGEIALPHPTKGRVSLEQQSIAPYARWLEVGRARDGYPLAIHLIQVRDDGRKEFVSFASHPPEVLAGRPFTVETPLQPLPDGELMCLIRVPGALRPAARSHALLTGDVDVRELTVVTERGTWQVPNQLTPNRPGSGRANSGLFRFPSDAIASVADGGMIVLRLRPRQQVTPGLDAKIVVTFGGRES